MTDGRVPGEGLYRLLLRLHPRWFRERYGAELIACFRDAWHAEASGRGRVAGARFWARTLLGTLGAAWRQRTTRAADHETTGRGGRTGVVMQDVRIGTRGLLRRPGWSAVVVLTLGLGMGATIAVFSVFHAVLLAPLPYEEGDRLVRLYLRNVVNGSEKLHLSAPAAEELRDEATGFAAVGILQSSADPGVDITDGDAPERIRALRVNRDYFEALGARPMAGRVFERHEETPETRLAVVTEDVADRYLGGPSSAVGRSVTLDGVSHSVIGVVSAGLRDPIVGDVDVWLPADLAETLNTWDNNYLDAFARLTAGVGVEEARAELEVLAARHADMGSAAAEKAFMVFPLKEDLVGSARPLLLALAGAAGFLLLLTCTNVASLLLARAATRERELAIRTTLGSTRSDLVRIFTVESCLVALAGGVCGLVVGRLGLEALVAIAPADLPLRDVATLGSWAPALAAGLAVGVGLALGVATFLPYTSPRVALALSEGGHSGQGGTAARRTRNLLVVTDVALAVVLLVGAGVLLRTLDALRSRDLGIDPSGVLAFDVHLPEARYPSAEGRIRFHDVLHARLAALPDVAAAGATSHLPLTGPANTWGTRRAAAVGEPFDSENVQGNQRIAAAGYFDAVGARLVAGRLLDRRDGPDAPHAVVVNESLVRTLFGDVDPVGRLLRVGPLYPVIVGVVDDIALTARTGSAPMVFHPYAQFGATRRWPMTHVVRVAGDGAAPWDAIRNALAEVDPDLVLHDPRRLEDVVGADVGDERFAALLLQTFAGLALALASLGLYGVLAHSVERRRHEIGVRMALGADRGRVAGMVIRHGVGLAAVGTAVGLLGALAMSRTLDFLVFEVGATDPAVFVSVPLLLLSVAVVASWLPARHATRVEPASSLEAT